MRAGRRVGGGWPARLALAATVAGCGDDVTPTAPHRRPRPLGDPRFGSAVDPEEFAKAAGALPAEAQSFGHGRGSYTRRLGGAPLLALAP